MPRHSFNFGPDEILHNRIRTPLPSVPETTSCPRSDMCRITASRRRLP